MNYRLGFDLGYASIGWACIALDDTNQPCGVIDLGVRIIPSGRDHESKPTSVARREKRGARRNRDRYLKRRDLLLNTLIALGLQPQDEFARQMLAKQEPLALRAKAVNEQLSLSELGRALFHLNQRRGFKSNRIADRKDDADSGKVLSGISQLQNKLCDSGMTLGQYLYHERLAKGAPTRLKAGAQQYDLWTDRAMYLAEFEAIINKQASFYPELLTIKVCEQLREIIFYQRNLRPQEAGFCTLIDGEKRARLAYPVVQQFRIYQEVNNLETLQESDLVKPITAEQRQKIAYYLTEDFSRLTKKGELSFAEINKILGMKGVKFNLDTQGRGGAEPDSKGLKPDSTTQIMQTAVPELWAQLAQSQQHALIDVLLGAQSSAELKTGVSQLLSDWQLDYDDSTLTALDAVRLVDGYGRLSVAAINKILPELKNGHIYSTACDLVGINHSDQRTGEIFPQGDLPYYGELLPKSIIGGSYARQDADHPEAYFGKINNPTVHIALNQFQKILNELVARYGKAPQSIHIEMARETTMSAKQMSEHNFEQSKNRHKNDAINEILAEKGLMKNHPNRMKYKLWQDLDDDPAGRCCPLSGQTISLDDLFSAEVEIEHILPYSRTYDDSRNNKMLCFKKANQIKSNRTPDEARADLVSKGYSWESILACAKKMSPNKQSPKRNKFWRFLPNAMERFADSDDNKIARMLNDTKYMAVIARQYAEFVCGPKGVKSLKGKHTSDLRHAWELERFTHKKTAEDREQNKVGIKDRSKHQHHAIDALVVALTDTATMQDIARANNDAAIKHLEKVKKTLKPPYLGFNEQGIRDIDRLVKNLVISHKLDHKNAPLAIKTGRSTGALHEETNYGHVYENIYATRTNLSANKFSKLKTIKNIASRSIREEVEYLFGQYSNSRGELTDKKGYEEELADYARCNNIKKVRIHLNRPHLIPICDKSGKAYRHVVGGGNYAAEIWCDVHGKQAGKKKGLWQCEVIRNFDANQKGFVPQWRQDHPTAHKVMRLQINDMVAVERLPIDPETGKSKACNCGKKPCACPKERLICRVQKMASEGTIILRHHNDALTDDKTQFSYAVSSLQRDNARKLFVSPAGKIYDPGHARKTSKPE